MDRLIFPLEAGRVGQSVGIRLCLVGHYSLSKYLDPLLTRNTIWALLLCFFLLGAHHYTPVTRILVIVCGNGWYGRGHDILADLLRPPRHTQSWLYKGLPLPH